MKTIPVAQYGNPPQPQYRLRQGAKKNSGCGSYLSGIFTLLVLGGAAVYLFVFDGYDQVLQLLGVGPTPAPTRRPTASPVPTVPTFKPTPLPTNVRGSDYIQVVFTNPGGTSAAATEAFHNASRRWSDILQGSFIQSFTIASGTFNPECNNKLENDGATPPGTHERLIIAADVGPIDGPGKVLGFAGPCKLGDSVNRPGLKVPKIGMMVFDSSDISNLESEGRLEDVILHEMGHVLGIGTLWDASGSTNLPEDLILDPIFVDFGGGDIRPGNIPMYKGHAAKAEFTTLLGVTDGGNIPLEDGSFNSLTPAQILAGNGRGSIDGHWKETEFANELMSPAINAGSNPLSRMSIRSLEDLGYAVDPSYADPYSKPLTAPGLVEGASNDIVHVLQGDIVVTEELKQEYRKSVQEADRRERRLGGGVVNP